MVTDYVTYVTI